MPRTTSVVPELTTLLVADRRSAWRGAATAEVAPAAERFNGCVRGNRATWPTVLKPGMTADCVRLLQQALADQGFLDASTVGGAFGSGTKAAVSALQTAWGLDADGLADQETLGNLCLTVCD